MKNIITLGAGIILSAFSMISCAKTNNANSISAEGKPNNSKTEIKMTTPEKTLVVFFSHTGENYAVGNISKGNTHIIADVISEETGAKTFEIVPENGYPVSYEECIDVAKKELQAHARPAIKDNIDISEYDIIFLGYPNWWGQPPMCVFTFIESHDWNGKTVIPFITHEGSGMGGTDRKIAEACKGATVAVGKGLAVRGATAQNDREAARKSVIKWIENLK